MTTIYTIGHSNHTWDTFAALLVRHGVRVLADVRSKPVSRRAPFASARKLPELLAKHGIRYVHMGEKLGGKPADPALYDDQGKPDYGKIASTEAFKQGIRELLGLLAEDSTVAIMCAEGDPAKCHRTLLVGAALEGEGVEMRHIRKDAVRPG